MRERPVEQSQSCRGGVFRFGITSHERATLALLRQYILEVAVVYGIDTYAMEPIIYILVMFSRARLFTHITLYATALHFFEVCAQCDKSRKSHSMHVSSTADCSQLSYVSSWVWGHTKAKMRSSIAVGSFSSVFLDTGTEGGVL